MFFKLFFLWHRSFCWNYSITESNEISRFFRTHRIKWWDNFNTTIALKNVVEKWFSIYLQHMKRNLQKGWPFLIRKSRQMVAMVQVTNEEELNVIIEHISSQSTTSQEESTSTFKKKKITNLQTSSFISIPRQNQLIIINKRKNIKIIMYKCYVNF